MNFGNAIEALKRKKVARDGWNGKGMYVYYIPEMKGKNLTENEKGLTTYNAYFAIKNVNDSVSTWVPSINDCLAEDWRIVADAQNSSEFVKFVENLAMDNGVDLFYKIDENKTLYGMINNIADIWESLI